MTEDQRLKAIAASADGGHRATHHAAKAARAAAAVLLGLSCAVAQAQYRFGQPLSPTVLKYVEEDFGLPQRYRKLLDDQIDQLKSSPACKEWPNRVEVFLVYGPDYEVKVHRDYQRIGERTEALRAFFSREHGLERVAAQISVEGPGQLLGYGSDIASVFVQCL